MTSSGGTGRSQEKFRELCRAACLNWHTVTANTCSSKKVGGF